MMNTMMFDDDDDDEIETPRAHIEDYLANIGTDPSHNLPSEKSDKGRRLRRSFVKTPVKEAKTREKGFHRHSTSLPSPGSLITPKSNIQHLLLGTDSAKTPLQREVASARLSRSHTRSLSHQAPLEWGQKVSMSPMYSASSYRNDGESTEKVFKPPKHYRSFRIPDPPPNVGNVSSHDRDETHDRSSLDGQEEDVDDDSPSQHVGDKNRHSVFEQPGDHTDHRGSFNDQPDTNTVHNDQTNTSTKQRGSFNDQPDTNTVHNDQKDTSTKQRGSLDDQPNSNAEFTAQLDTNSEHRGSLNDRPGINSEHTDSCNDQPTTSDELNEQQGNSNHSKNNNYSVQKNIHKNASKEVIKVLEEMSKTMQMEKASKIYDLNSVSSDEESLNHSMLPSSMSLANKSMSNRAKTPDKGQNSKKSSITSEISNSKSKQDTPASSLKVRLTRSGSKIPSLKKQNILSDNEEEFMDGSMSADYSELFSMKSVEQSVGKVTPTTTRTPIQSQSSKDMYSSTKMKRSKQESSVKKMITVDREPLSDTHSPMPFSSSKKRRLSNLNDVFNDSDPSSSTPFKRSKSVLSSTKIQASISNYLSSKESVSGSKSANRFSTIGDLSPIRPDGEHGENIPSPELANTDNDDDVFSRDVAKQSAKSQMSNSTSNKERTNNQVFGEEEEDEEDEIASGFSPLRTPVIDWAKRPQPVSVSEQVSRQSVQNDNLDIASGKQSMVKKKKTTSSAKKVSAASTSLLPRKTVKFYSELYSSMKIDKEALDEIEKVSQQFLANTLETVESYCLHAGRKIINEADFILLMKIQKLIKNKEDLYDLIREYLPMELRCELIPCFPSQ